MASINSHWGVLYITSKGKDVLFGVAIPAEKILLILDVLEYYRSMFYGRSIDVWVEESIGGKTHRAS